MYENPGLEAVEPCCYRGLSLPVVLFGENLFESMAPTFSAGLIHTDGIMVDDKFFTAAIAT